MDNVSIDCNDGSRQDFLAYHETDVLLTPPYLSPTRNEARTNSCGQLQHKIDVFRDPFPVPPSLPVPPATPYYPLTPFTAWGSSEPSSATNCPTWSPFPHTTSPTSLFMDRERGQVPQWPSTRLNLSRQYEENNTISPQNLQLSDQINNTHVHHHVMHSQYPSWPSSSVPTDDFQLFGNDRSSAQLSQNYECQTESHWGNVPFQEPNHLALSSAATPEDLGLQSLSEQQNDSYALSLETRDGSSTPIKMEEDYASGPNSDSPPTIESDCQTRDEYSKPRRTRRPTTPSRANFFCQQCPQVFARRHNMNVHVQNVHDPNQPKPFICDWPRCDKRFRRINDLTRHRTSVHLKERPFKCQMCGAGFPRRDSCTRHEADSCRSQRAHHAEQKRILATGPEHLRHPQTGISMQEWTTQPDFQMTSSQVPKTES
ncbi:MAG: hypothetical protein M1828_003908 [Chrysothrix sp. TS-e1954]|nr:MAG: hypothetical protein M1828_003908 [Chrysothrix sp. TS-e1954]